jgi:hypothetical protein
MDKTQLIVEFGQLLSQFPLVTLDWVLVQGSNLYAGVESYDALLHYVKRCAFFQNIEYALFLWDGDFIGDFVKVLYLGSSKFVE